MPAETRYAKSGDVHIAYQVTGAGPFDLVWVPGFVSHLEADWQNPVRARIIERFGSFCCLIRFDKRGTDHVPTVGDVDAVFGEVEEFLTGIRDVEVPDRVLATVLFTDIVDSTQRAAALGDAGWRKLLGRHHALVRREIAKHRRGEIDTSGDGFFASFDGPARAVRCAQAVVGAARSHLGIQIRAGLHTGECEKIEQKLTGLTVHIGARVAGLANAGEVLVSNTVKDLVAGSGLRFDDRGDHVLKGVPGRWHLYAALSA